MSRRSLEKIVSTRRSAYFLRRPMVSSNVLRGGRVKENGVRKMELIFFLISLALSHFTFLFRPNPPDLDFAPPEFGSLYNWTVITAGRERKGRLNSNKSVYIRRKCLYVSQ